MDAKRETDVIQAAGPDHGSGEDRGIAPEDGGCEPALGGNPLQGAAQRLGVAPVAWRLVSGLQADTQSPLKRAEGWLWWCFLLWMAYAVRVLSLEAQGLWRDEVDILNFSTAPWPELLARLIRPGENGPLYLLIMRGWIALTGESVFAMRFFSLLFGVLGVVLIYRLGRRMVGRKAGLWAAVLLAFSPYFVWYAEEVKMYTWVPFLVLLALYALDRACARSQWGWWAVVVVATSFAFYSHILAALLIPVVILWFLFHPRRDRRAWIGGAVALALLTLPYLPLLKWQAGLAFTSRQTGYPAYTFVRMVQMLLSGWSTGVAATGWGLTAGSAIFGALAVGGLGALGLQGKWRTALMLLVWVAVPLVAIWAVSLYGPIFTDRYLIWAAPAFYLAIAAILAFLEQQLRIAALLSAAVLLAFSGTYLYRQVAVPVKPQFREVAAFLTEHRDLEALLLFQIPYNHIVVDYYLPSPLEPWAEAPYTNWPAADGQGYLWNTAEVDAAMQSLTSGYRDLWLVYSEAGMWDNRALAKTWLDTHAVLRESVGFYGVDLYRYELPAP